ncbi:SPOR domain-containing protein, partial [Bordetella avium]
VPPPVAATTPPPAVKPAEPPRLVEKPQPIKPVEKPKPDTTRSDDGARALALLEGRSPAPAAAAKPAAKPAANGNFVLQVASYTTQADAQERRGKLHQAGVTNAFVEAANINGKQQYRLRVGPFPSREAAQAAQARLRTLGYDNGFIAAQ